jgi:hypothetical protein
MRFLLVLAAACGGAPTSPACERARDQALALQEHYVSEVMAETPDDRKPALRRQAAREVAKLEQNFVAACAAAVAHHPPCLARSETANEPACREFIAKLARATVQ